MKNLSRNRWSPRRDLKPGPTENEAKVLSTRPRRSVELILNYKL
jgi:hypothetical protein